MPLAVAAAIQPNLIETQLGSVQVETGCCVANGMTMFKPADQLEKGAPEKVVLAWWLRKRTTASLRWIGQVLAMGHYTRVTQAVSRMDRNPQRKLGILKQRLLKTERTE